MTTATLASIRVRAAVAPPRFAD